MSYLKNYNKVTPAQRLSRLVTSILAVCIIAMTFLSTPVSAAGGVDFEDVMQLAGYLTKNSSTTTFAVDSYDSNSDTGNDWSEPDTTAAGALNSNNIPTWELLVSMSNAQNKIASKFPTVKRCCATASTIINTFGEQATYQKAYAKLKNIAWEYDATSRTFTVTNAGDQHAFDNALRDFKSAAASSAADSAFGDIYDSQNWNPNAGVAGDLLSSMYGVINSIFYAVANIMLWFFLLQTGLDALYIIAEPIRPFIGPRSSGGGGGLNNGGDRGFLSKIHIPICSSAAEQACNGGGGIGNGGNGAGGASAGNAFFSYALKRFPVLICCAVYLILVTLGYWPKLISWVSGFAVNIIDFIMRIGQ